MTRAAGARTSADAHVLDVRPLHVVLTHRLRKLGRWSGGGPLQAARCGRRQVARANKAEPAFGAYGYPTLPLREEKISVAIASPIRWQARGDRQVREESFTQEQILVIATKGARRTLDPSARGACLA